MDGGVVPLPLPVVGVGVVLSMLILVVYPVLYWWRSVAALDLAR